MAETKQERERKKDLFQHFYVNTQLSQKEICEKVGVSEQTGTKWVKDNKEKWDKLRTSVSITKQEQIRRVYDQLAAINDKIRTEQKGVPTSSDADILSKLASVIEKLEKETNITDIVSVFMRFLEWLRGVDNDKAKEISGLCDAFIREMLK